jgi:predicted DNA-binding transcriptional regulator YafY
MLGVMATAPSVRRDRQVVRLLGLFKTLAEGGRPSVHQLAARFKTRRETIYRDLRALQAIGYPIVGDESGLLSRPQLAPGLKTALPPVPFTSKEVAALVWAVKEAGNRQPFRAALSTAMPKLQALVPSQAGRVGLAIEGAVSGWTRGVKDYTALEPLILELVKAIVSHTRCRVTYQSPARKQPRTYPFDPYRLLSVHGGLYCVGFGPEHGHVITLAVDRIRHLEATSESFQIDPAFDPKRLEAEAFGVSWEDPMHVVLRFSADQAPYVKEREWHPTQRLRNLRDGRVELAFTAGGEFEIIRWILGWGDSVEVIRPASLREAVAGRLGGAQDFYREGNRPRQIL